MFYDRKIKYLDYREDGEKVRIAGFVKIEVRDQACKIQIQVNGLRPMAPAEREIWLENGRRESRLGNIVLQNGKGEFRQRAETGALGEEGIPYEELALIRVKLGMGRELVCRWKEAVSEEVLKEIPKMILDDPGLSEVLPEKSDVSREVREIQDIQELQGIQDIHAAEAAPGRPPEETSRLSEEEFYPPEEAPHQEAPKRPPVLYEDKWQQLSSIYPHIAPFGDQRDYLSIGPADFVILQSPYHRLVSNSFLLHGYYLYEHLILARTERMGKPRYYVGVPGSFYEKEKQAALLFGFESFECRNEPVQAGDFGYYCIRVEI